jgi:hypothetical protein
MSMKWSYVGPLGPGDQLELSSALEDADAGSTFGAITACGVKIGGLRG